MTAPENRQPLTPWSALYTTALGATIAGREYVAVVDFLELGKDARLYRDGVLVDKGSTPTKLRSEGVVVDLRTSMLGVKKATLTAADTAVEMPPLPETLEFRRLQWGRRHRSLDRVIAVMAVLILLIAGALGALYLWEGINEALTGTEIEELLPFALDFTVPFTVPSAWWQVLGVLALLAAIDRALRLKYSRWIDTDFWELDD